MKYLVSYINASWPIFPSPSLIFQNFEIPKETWTHLFPMHPFSTPFFYMVFWCFQGVEKGCIGNKWVKKSWYRTQYFPCHILYSLAFLWLFLFMTNLHYITNSLSQRTFICSSSTIETLGKGTKYVQFKVNNKDIRTFICST